MDNAVEHVSITSGIRIRVNRKSPTHVAKHKPAYNPARLPNAQTPKAAVTKQSTIAESAIGMRADQS
jgi:hypothetical protein